MKKLNMASIVLVTIATLFWFAYAENQVDQSQYDLICQEERVELENAISRLTDSPEDLMPFKQMLSELQACKGYYILDRTDDDGDSYYAEVDIYLSYGVPFCHVKYPNYQGEIEEAKINYDMSGRYLFASNTEGIRYGKKSEFTILISEDRIRIQWETYDHILDRYEGVPPDIDIKSSLFRDFRLTGTYTMDLILEKIDEIFENYEYDWLYNEDERELSIYVAVGINVRPRLEIGWIDKDNWKSMLSQLKDVTSTFQEVIGLSYRYSWPKSRCSITLVGSLNLANTYSDYEILAVISNGEIIYDFLDD